jgi:hypothetical protein
VVSIVPIVGFLLQRDWTFERLGQRTE